jgi:hypothetical protein
MLDGLDTSPFMAVHFYYLAEEFAHENCRRKTNPIRWDHVKLNLPGESTFNPTLPHVMKWDNLVDKTVGDFGALVNDLRASGYSVEQAWAISQQVVSRLQYLGLQDAPQKQRPPVWTPGAWAGAMFMITDTEVLQSVVQAKWDKAKAQIEELAGLFKESPEPDLNFKHMEQIMVSCVMWQ